MPGVSLAIDTGEGRFINIRGIDGNLNDTTFGGVALLNTQPGGTYFGGGGRAIELDTVPIGAVDRLVVRKTGLPDQEAEGFGGSVELTPRTAVGLKHPFSRGRSAAAIRARTRTATCSSAKPRPAPRSARTSSSRSCLPAHTTPTSALHT